MDGRRIKDVEIIKHKKRQIFTRVKICLYRVGPAGLSA